MGFQTIETSLSPRGVATIVLNRPDRGNAINQTMLEELVGHLAELASDPKARVVVLRANGKHFCAGADVSGQGGEKTQTSATLGDLIHDLDRLPKPVISIVQGGAVGGGAGLACASDVTLLDRDGFISIPEVRLGFAPGGLVAVLMRQMGAREFRRYGMSGERIKAEAALRMGLASEIVDAESCDIILEEIIDAFLLGAPGAQAVVKASVTKLETPSLAPLKHRDGPHGMHSEEAREGVAAFREKRKPNWYVTKS
jgi:methylglutaconyl-CoA hydratase